MKRIGIYNTLFSAKALFITGLLIMPAVLFNPSAESRIIQFLFFLFLSYLCGKNINIVFTVLITFFIITFNLIIPYGYTLFNIGTFKITSGALEAGVHRAVTLQALVMLSKITVRQDLKLPGAFGTVLAQSLQMFSVLLAGKHKITEKNLIARIDSLLLSLSVTAESSNQKTKPIGFILIAITVILSYLLCGIFYSC
ncbi:MAG: hypothetical protein FWD28_07140 [Treponema sp.]|nr:hypothetical protein [Treponema sp.]